MFLGIKLDKHCDWKAHVEYVCDKLDRFVFAIKRLRLTVSSEAALSAYHGYVSSVLSYGLLLWGNSVDVNRAFNIQKKCLRAISGAHFMDSCKPLFKKFRILPLVCMYIKELCVFVKQYPEYFESHSQVGNRTNGSVRNTHKYKIYYPKCRLELYNRNVYVHAITIYNKLPDSFKNLTLNVFKRKITNWLLEHCFYDINEYKNMTFDKFT